MPLSKRIFSAFRVDFTKRALALLLVFVFALSAFPTGAIASVESHRKKAQEALEKAENAETRANQLSKDIEALDGKADEYRKKAESYEPQISEAVKKSDRLDEELDKLNEEKARLISDITSTTAEHKANKQMLADRVNESYRTGETTIFLLIFEAESITDFITRTEVVNRILQQNADITRELKITQRKLENDKQQLDKIVKEAKEKAEEAQEVASNLINLKAGMKQAANQVETTEEQKTSLMNANLQNAEKLRELAAEEEATANSIESRLAALASEQGGTEEGTKESSSGMAWPVPGFRRITSPFGWRFHPILGYKKFHNGIDIGRNAGQSINGAALVAVKSGTVITAGYLNGYGNTVIVDHGNGVSTVYAHQQNGGIKVSVGQKVSKGQRVGTVGSTGYSTGPHLHFEVRINGVPKNPMNYL